ncbi:FecR family protein [Brevundimonas sp.]|jgi:transmembrane sensor|uniref:FecR family protein n=1 Tax=Brevundimonas sp. TaxID=1871086 RepID=UPI0037C145E1
MDDGVEPRLPGGEPVEVADRGAVEWLVRLQDNPNDAVMRGEFEAWLEASPDNAAAWAETQYVVALMGAVPPIHERKWARPPAPPARSTRPWRGRRSGRDGVVGRRLAAAACVAAACIGVLGMPEIRLRLEADHVSGLASPQRVELADGSVVEMAPSSAISLDYSGAVRRVRLLRGEAYFEVRRDPARPFHVMAGDVETTVLGTGFDVMRIDNGAVVAVRHGRVRVQAEKTGVSTQLNAGDRVSVAADGMYEDRIRPDRVGAWTTGDLIVNDRLLREVIDMLRPWYGGVILASGDRLDSQRVTGRYDLRDPLAAVDALGQAHGLRITRLSPWLVVVSAR